MHRLPTRPASTPARPPRSRAVLVAPGIALALLAAACGDSTSGGGGSDGGADDPSSATRGLREVERTKVVAETLVRRDLVEELETTAVLEADRQVPVVARVSGQVVEIVAEEGDTVQRGQVLATLDERSETLAVESARIALEEAEQTLAANHIAIEEARTAIDTAKNDLAQAERDLDRDEKLFAGEEDGVSAVSQRVLEQSRLARDQAAQALAQQELALDRAKLERDRSATAVKRARVTLEEAQLALDRMSIVAPFDGVVAMRTIRLGQNLGAGEEAFVVADPLDLRVIFYRPQRELATFAARPEGELALTATSEALPGVRFRGRIVRVAPTIDAESGSFRLTAEMDHAPLDDGPERLLPGMLLRLRIVTDRHANTLAVRKRAVVREADQAFVFTVEATDDGAVARRRLVREGYSDAVYVEVAAADEPAFDESTRVVVIGARDLSDGDPLEIEER